MDLVFLGGKRHNYDPLEQARGSGRGSGREYSGGRGECGDHGDGVGGDRGRASCRAHTDPGLRRSSQPFLGHGVRPGSGGLLDAATRKHRRYKGCDSSGGERGSPGTVDLGVGVRWGLRTGGAEPDASGPG